MKWFIHVIKNYANFEGRARRQEYWMYILFVFLFSIVAGVIDGTLGLTGEMGTGVFSSLFALFLILPSLSAGARRLHDTGKSGLWLFLYLLPVLGSLILLIFMVLPGDEGPNRYGPDPKVSGPQPSAEILDSGI